MNKTIIYIYIYIYKVEKGGAAPFLLPLHFLEIYAPEISEIFVYKHTEGIAYVKK